ncbi:MAG: S8 family serine peptidase, partial [Deltaproteobacteria bacterium]|nr:S8 family serine peptidase [Deltaproteobacteria bacterium]
LLTEKNSLAMFGGKIKGDKVFNFSSRGGELNKPDGLAPGIASSTVPSYEKKDLFRGTSMASPQVAGAMAVILSAFQQEKTSGKEMNSGILKRALKYSAKPLKDYGWVDQGGGVISVPDAYNTMKAYLKRGDGILMDYIVETEAPTLAGTKGSAAFWRAGGFFPSGSEFQEFKVRPVFRKDAGSEQIENFYRTFTLDSSAPWLKPDRTKAYIKGNGDLAIRVFYDEKFFKGKTGVFTGKITAYNGSMSKGKDAVEFELPAAVVIPEKFGGEKGYEKAFKNATLDAGDIKRYFLSVPAGATSMIIDAEAPEKKYSMVYFYLFNQYGKFTPIKKSFINTNEGEKMSGVVSGNDLTPGIYELIAYAPVSAPQSSSYDLYARFSGLGANLKGI